eukprot:519314_1
MFAVVEKRKQEAVYGTIACFIFVMMIGLITKSMIIISLFAILMSLPAWFGYFVIKLRYMIFQKINGEEGVQLPSEKYNAKIFTYLYNHPDVNLRSKQNNVGLSDFFWYLLAPAHFIHQEHLESADEKYNILKQVTMSIISCREYKIIELCNKYIYPVFEELKTPKIVHLRQLLMPVFIKIFYELIFGQELKNKKELKLIYESVNDVITALKFLKTRNMTIRNKLTKHLCDKLDKNDNETIQKHFRFDPDNKVNNFERALFIQGVVLTTGAVQLSEAFAHLCIALAQHKIPGNGKNSETNDFFIYELFRVFPLFGIAHRITSNDIQLPNSEEIIPEGTVLCFNYPEFHRIGFKNSSSFDYKRWYYHNKRNSNYIPFGAKNNRPCPAESISMHFMKQFVSNIVDKTDFFTSILHTRSMADGGLCLVAPKEYKYNKILFKVVMTGMWLYVQFRNIFHSVIQLYCGGYMLWDAKRKQLAKTWVEQHTCN